MNFLLGKDRILCKLSAYMPLTEQEMDKRAVILQENCKILRTYL